MRQGARTPVSELGDRDRAAHRDKCGGRIGASPQCQRFCSRWRASCTVPRIGSRPWRYPSDGARVGVLPKGRRRRTGHRPRCRLPVAPLAAVGATSIRRWSICIGDQDFRFASAPTTAQAAGRQSGDIFSQIPVERGSGGAGRRHTSTDTTPEVVTPYLHRRDFRYLRNQRMLACWEPRRDRAARPWRVHLVLGEDDLTRPGVIERVLALIQERRASD